MPDKLSYNDHPDDERHVLNRLHENPNITDWERGFIESVLTYHNAGGFLSEKQKATLSKIWEKY